MKILFMISHPAHFHMFRNTISNLKKDGHEVVIVIRPKDMLEQLCIDAGMEFYKVKNRPKRWGMFGLAVSLMAKTIEVLRIARKEKPDMLIGSDGVLAYVGTLCRIPSFEFFEDDVRIIQLYAKIFFPFYSNVVCPYVCDAEKWNSKKVGYPGYQKLTYLHPKRFTPNPEIVRGYGIGLNEGKKPFEPYYIIRFAKLSAHHDVGVHGFTKEIAETVINKLKAHGRVFITSEAELPAEFEQYRLRIRPLDIHHVLAFASLYIGDSQSMAVEASMLGTPCIRFNDFVGKKKISVLEELEHTYGLTYGISSTMPEVLYQRVDEILTMPDARKTYQQRREKMLKDKIDVTAFWTWFIEHYPQSVNEVQEADKDFWERYR